MKSHAKAQRREGIAAALLRAIAPLREICLAVAWLCVALSASLACADELVAETILHNLHRPCGVAVRPGGTADRYDVFVADSGAGRVVRWSNLKPKQASEVVTGFQTHRAADPFHQTGPLALWFLDPGLLVVGTSRDGGGDLVRAYELPDDDSVLSAEVARDATAPRDEKEGAIEGATCFAMARSRANEFVPDMLVLAVRDANGPGRLSSPQAGRASTPQALATRKWPNSWTKITAPSPSATTKITPTSVVSEPRSANIKPRAIKHIPNVIPPREPSGPARSAGGATDSVQSDVIPVRCDRLERSR